MHPAEAHVSVCCMRESRLQHTLTHAAEAPDSEQMLTDTAEAPARDREHWNAETAVRRGGDGPGAQIYQENRILNNGPRTGALKASKHTQHTRKHSNTLANTQACKQVRNPSNIYYH